jgi:glycosyltransferase involved in cell wall biosynthesis
MSLKLSIITVNFNNKDGLINTAESVIAQIFTDYEWIVIDGGSTDGSVDVIKEYAYKTDKLVYWCSEKDGGVYPAMNKGIEKSNGEYCWFLNSGDFVCKNTTLEEIFAKKFDEDIVYGNIISTDKKKYKIIKSNNRNVRSPVSWVNFPAIPHQASFIKKKLFAELGGYRTDLKLASDVEFPMKAIFNHNASTKYINIVFAFYDIIGLSSVNNTETRKTKAWEYGRIMIDIFPDSYMKIYASFYSHRFLKGCLKTIRLLCFLIEKFFIRIKYLGVKTTILHYKYRLLDKVRKKR